MDSSVLEQDSAPSRAHNRGPSWAAIPPPPQGGRTFKVSGETRSPQPGRGPIPGRHPALRTQVLAGPWTASRGLALAGSICRTRGGYEVAKRGRVEKELGKQTTGPPSWSSSALSPLGSEPGVQPLMSPVPRYRSGSRQGASLCEPTHLHRWVGAA